MFGKDMHEGAGKADAFWKKAETFKTKYNLKTRLAEKHRELTRAKT